MDFAGWFRSQVHHQVGASEREGANTAAGGGDLESIVVATGGFKRRYDLNGAGQQPSLAFQLSNERISGDDLGCGFQPANYDAGDARPDRRSQICQHQFWVNLYEYLGAAGFDSVQSGGYAFAG